MMSVTGSLPSSTAFPSKRSVTASDKGQGASAKDRASASDLALDHLPLDPLAPFTELVSPSTPAPTTASPRPKFKAKITADLAAAGLVRKRSTTASVTGSSRASQVLGRAVPDLARTRRSWEPDRSSCGPTQLRAELPVLHPHMEDFKPTGTPEPMLAKAPDTWLYKTAADGVKLKRETNSMPQWAGRAGTTCGSATTRTATVH